MSLPSLPPTAATSQRGVAFTVYGIPAPQGSKRVFVVQGRAVLTEDSKKSAPWRDSVAAAAVEAMDGRLPFDGPIELLVTFVFVRPKSSKRKYPTVRPDGDKLIRAVADGLTAGGVYRDDAQVTDWWFRKRYGDHAHAEITVREVLSA